MVTLGIDHSIKNLAYTVLDDGPIILECGIMNFNEKEHVQDRLGSIKDFLGNILLKYTVRQIALQKSQLMDYHPLFAPEFFFNIRGIIYILSHNYKCFTHEYESSDVKKAIGENEFSSPRDFACALCRIIPDLTDKVESYEALYSVAIGIMGLWKK